jgi:hypothetical protein
MATTNPKPPNIHFGYLLSSTNLEALPLVNGDTHAELLELVGVDEVLLDVMGGHGIEDSETLDELVEDGEAEWLGLPVVEGETNREFLLRATQECANGEPVDRVDGASGRRFTMDRDYFYTMAKGALDSAKGPVTIIASDHWCYSEAWVAEARDSEGKIIAWCGGSGVDWDSVNEPQEDYPYENDGRPGDVTVSYPEGATLPHIDIIPVQPIKKHYNMDELSGDKAENLTAVVAEDGRMPWEELTPSQRGILGFVRDKQYFKREGAKGYEASLDHLVTIGYLEVDENGYYKFKRPVPHRDHIEQLGLYDLSQGQLVEVARLEGTVNPFDESCEEKYQLQERNNNDTGLIQRNLRTLVATGWLIVNEGGTYTLSEKLQEPREINVKRNTSETPGLGR